MKIGILGGSFDPIHFGHLNLATSMKELCRLDEVLFVPAGVSPFKTSRPPIASAEHRLAMLKLAIASIPGLRILTDELTRSGPSFTIDTVRKLAKDSSLELHLLLGDDQIAQFYLWKEADELLRLAPPLVGVRNNDSTPLMPGAKWVEIPTCQVSSTEVRERLKKKLDCSDLVPSSVLDYIDQHRLYSCPT